MNKCDNCMHKKICTEWEKRTEYVKPVKNEICDHFTDMGEVIKLPEQDLSQMSDYLEPLKVYSALSSELMKLDYRKEHKPKDISILDYTIIYALIKVYEDAQTGLKRLEGKKNE